jgi:hypothetical protein
MFEQSYVDQAPTEPLHEGDFLYHYEIKSWQLGPRLYQILGASVVVNLVLLTIFGQASFLTAKGCDSPLVGSVCQVLDTVYVGAMLFGTDRDFADYAYEKTDLGDVDVTFVDVSNAEAPLEYPAGYFQLANPEQQFGMTDQASLNNGFIAPGIPSNPTITTTPDLTNTPQVLPTPNANAVEGTLPTFNDPSSVSPRKGRGGRVRTVPGDNTVAVANNNPTASPSPVPSPTIPPGAPTDEDAINSRPFKDLANRANELLAKQTLDLQAPLQYTATAKIDENGKIVKGSYRTIKAVSSNSDLAGLVKDSVAAFDESNLLKFLAPISGERVNFMLQQDQTVISAGVQSELERETKAASAKSVLDLGILVARQKKEAKINDFQDQLAKLQSDPKTPPEAIADLQRVLQNAQDDLLLINSINVVADGKKLNIGFSVPKEVLHQMLKRKLDEQAAEMKKVNGTASGNSNVSTAAK